jgi:hypothetical protein
MQNHSFNLQGGVLIIGSLLWQDHVGQNNNTTRLNWRMNRLNTDDAIGVKAPIRYGRISSENIYTMTFANSCRGKKLGNAFVIPFRNNPITSLNELRIESENLATAEGMRRTFVSSDNQRQPWCILGIVFNNRKILPSTKDTITKWWHSELSKDVDFERFNSNNFRIGCEKPCILPSGILNIPWMSTQNGVDQNQLDKFDFLIATATLPNVNKYPSISKLVNSINGDKNRKYFRNNFANNITTYQDSRIIKKINIENGK